MRRVWPVSRVRRNYVLAVLTVAAILFPVVAVSQYVIDNADCVSNRACTSPNCFVEMDGGQPVYFCCLAGSGTFTTCRRISAGSCQQRNRTQMVDCQQCYRGTQPCQNPCQGGNMTINQIHSCY